MIRLEFKKIHGGCTERVTQKGVKLFAEFSGKAFSGLGETDGAMHRMRRNMPDLIFFNINRNSQRDRNYL